MAVEPDDVVAAPAHFARRPAGEVFLEIAVAFLGQESVGGEDDNALGGEVFQVVQQLPPVFFGQVFDEIEGDTGVEATFAEQWAQFANIAQQQFVVGGVGAGFFKGRLEAFHTDQHFDREGAER